MPPVIAALREFFSRHPGRTLLAVSGGADSLALLIGAAEVAPDRIGVACIDHGLRAESTGELEAVRAVAERLGLAFHARSLSLLPGPGMEARARVARYAALEEIRVAGGYAWIATAHTREDQAETLLMRLARGAGLRGAGAIRVRAGCIVRPLLGVGRAEAAAQVALHGLDPARDPSNADPSLLRARIRAGVLPALVAAAGPGSVGHLAAFASRAAEDEALLADQAGRALARARVEGGLDAVAVRSLPGPLRRRALAAFLEEASVAASAALLERVEAAVQRGGRVGLPGRAVLRSEGGLVRIAGRAGLVEETPLDPGVWVRFGRFRLCLDREVPPGSVAQGLAGAAGALRVRGRRPGDRVEAPDGRRRAVQDVLVDARVPAEERDAWPLVVDGSGRVISVAALWPLPREGIDGPGIRTEPASATGGAGL